MLHSDIVAGPLCSCHMCHQSHTQLQCCPAHNMCLLMHQGNVASNSCHHSKFQWHCRRKPHLCRRHGTLPPPPPMLHFDIVAGPPYFCHKFHQGHTQLQCHPAHNTCLLLHQCSVVSESCHHSRFRWHCKRTSHLWYQHGTEPHPLPMLHSDIVAGPLCSCHMCHQSHTQLQCCPAHNMCLLMHQGNVASNSCHHSKFQWHCRRKPHLCRRHGTLPPPPPMLH